MNLMAAYESLVRTQWGAMGVTLLVEGVVAAALARSFGVAPSRAARAAIAGSLLTHPFVWWAHFQLLPVHGYWTSLALVECIAVFGEAPIYRLAGASWTRAVVLSLLVNAASVLAGLSPWIWRQIAG